MKVIAKYVKEVEVSDDISEDEIKDIKDKGIPYRFDCMADAVDDIKPLSLSSLSYNGTEYKINDAEEEAYKVIKFITNVLFNLFIFVSLLLIFGMAKRMYETDTMLGIASTGLTVIIIISLLVMYAMRVVEYIKRKRREK